MGFPRTPYSSNVLHCDNSLNSVFVPNMKFPASTVSQILGGSRNSESGSRDLYMTPFDLLLHFSLKLTAVRLHAKYEVSSFNRSRDIRMGFQNSKIGSGEPLMTPFDPILIFFSSELTAVRLLAKYVRLPEKNEVSSFRRSRNIRGS